MSEEIEAKIAEETPTDFLSMSDEDMLDTPEPVLETSQEEDNIGDEETVEETVSESIPDTEDEEKTEELTEETEEVIEDTSSEEIPSESIDFEAEYKKLITPFKANGKEIKVNSVDEGITLMQMGANYVKKMSALKPSLQIVKMLEKQNLLDADKLSFLIDLNNKNPEAVKKFLQDSGIDPLDIDTEEKTDYTPNNYTVSDKEAELDDILMDIQGTESFDQTIEVISKQWDDESRQVLLDQPSLIKTINEHMANGVFESIANVVDRERMLGRLVGVSDITAYKQVGDVLYAGAEPDKAAAPANEGKTQKQNVKRDAKRRAAASTNTGSNATKQEDFNPLALSDEEFEKLAASNQFL